MTITTTRRKALRHFEKNPYDPVFYYPVPHSNWIECWSNPRYNGNGMRPRLFRRFTIGTAERKEEYRNHLGVWEPHDGYYGYGGKNS